MQTWSLKTRVLGVQNEGWANNSGPWKENSREMLKGHIQDRELTAKVEIKSIFALEISTWISTFVGLVSLETVPRRALEVWPSAAHLLWLLWVLWILFKAAAVSIFVQRKITKQLIGNNTKIPFRPASLQPRGGLFSKLLTSQADCQTQLLTGLWHRNNSCVLSC